MRNLSLPPFSSCCYVMMPLRLKNVGATYELCMLRCFDSLVDDVLEAYVDDIMVKTQYTSQLVQNLERAFERLYHHGVKLNPEKCVFGVPKGTILGFIVSERGIKANLEKIAEINRLGPIKNLKGV